MQTHFSRPQTNFDTPFFGVNYLPFGMEMPGRNGGLLSFRYGFNGKEKDDAVKGVARHYNFGSRLYDPRTGRFFSIDPAIENYPDQSPFGYAANNPVAFIDVEGEWPCWSCWAQAGLSIASAALDFVPVVGQIKAVAEVAIGYSLDGTKLSKTERLVGLVGLFPGGKLVSAGLAVVYKGVQKVTKIVSKTKVATKVRKVVKKAHVRIRTNPKSPPPPKSPPKKTGTAGGRKAGEKFSQKDKAEVIKENKERYGGETTCEECKVKTVPAKKSEKGVTPPSNETQVDHIVSKDAGGNGDPSNGQVLCRSCNRAKSNKIDPDAIIKDEAGNVLDGPLLIRDKDGLLKEIHIYEDGKYLGKGKLDTDGRVIPIDQPEKEILSF